MRINSINNFSNIYNNNKTSFKHVAVPYPEYENGYKPQPHHSKFKIDSIVNKLSELFTPEVTKQADEIKQQIDIVCDDEDQSPKDNLLSVLA